MPDILRGIGNAAKFGGEWIQNIADPNRQKYQRATELAQQKYLYDQQNQAMRDNALNDTNIKIQQMQNEADKFQQWRELATSPNSSPFMMEQGFIGMGGEPNAVPRDGTGPRIQPDPSFFMRPMTPLQEAEIFERQNRGFDLGQQGLMQRPLAQSKIGLQADQGFQARQTGLAQRPPDKIYAHEQGITNQGQSAEMFGGNYHAPDTTAANMQALAALEKLRLGYTTTQSPLLEGMNETTKKVSGINSPTLNDASGILRAKLFGAPSSPNFPASPMAPTQYLPRQTDDPILQAILDNM